MLSHVKLALKAWFPLNVSVIATNRSCLLARTLLRFAGFHIDNHRLVYCKVFCIWRHVNRVAHPVFHQKYRLSESRRYSFCFWLCSFFSEYRKYFFSCVVGFYRPQSQHIAAQALAKVQHVRFCCDLAGFCCEGCDPLGSLAFIHLEASRAVVRPANTCMETRLYKILIYKTFQLNKRF